MAWLDCETPHGRQYIDREHEICDLVERLWGVTIVSTGRDRRDKACRYDGLMYSGRNLIAVIEARTRDDTTWQTIDVVWKTYLITEEKLLKCVERARRLGVPFVLIIGCCPSKECRYCTVHDRDLPNIKRKWEKTKKTCNGEIWRWNRHIAAGEFIPFDGPTALL